MAEIIQKQVRLAYCAGIPDTGAIALDSGELTVLAVFDQLRDHLGLGQG